MKKTLHRFTALALVLVLLAGLCLQALAMWPAPGITSDGDYLDAGTLYGSNLSLIHISEPTRPY